MPRRRRGQPIHGWVILDKSPGMTSTQGVGAVRRLFDADKAGHAGTLDPMATGLLPIALGEATKTIPYVMDGTKRYSLRVRWGEATNTDDAEGKVIATSPLRPDRAGIEAALPAFLGQITQIPPQFSALKIDGQRAYDLARRGEDVDLAPRQVRIDRFALTAMVSPDEADFEVICGKGTYIRSLARDLGQCLGSCGHLTRLRRLQVGPFREDAAISLDELQAAAHNDRLLPYLLPIETALADIPALALSETEAKRLRQGQPVSLLCRADKERLLSLTGSASCPGPAEGKAFPQGVVQATQNGQLVALVRLEKGALHPVRVLNP